MTREEFRAKFRGRMLIFLTDSWAVRREVPSAMGLVMDRHLLEVRNLLDEMFDSLTQDGDVPGETEYAVNNGRINKR